MNWNRQAFEPRRPPLKCPDRLQFPSPPLCRLCAATVGTVGGLLVFYGATALLAVDSDFMRSDREWRFKEIAALGAGLLAGLFCSLLGFGVGASVDVRSDKKNHVLAVLWHYLANGSIIWFVLLSMALTKALGQGGTKQLFDHLGLWYSSLAIAGTGGLGSIAIGSFLLVIGQLGFQSKPKYFLCFLLSLPMSAAMGYTQFRLLNLSTGYWVIIAVLFPLVLVPVSAMMVARDVQQRRKMLSMTKG